MDKEAIIELFDAAKDKEQQIKIMTNMGFGSRYQILQVLHENNRALDIKMSKPGPKPKAGKEDPKEAAADENPQKDKRQEQLPLPLDVKQLLIDELEGIDLSIKELQENIDGKMREKRRLEDLYNHIVACVGMKAQS